MTEEKKSIMVTLDQHEWFTRQKRGNQTSYDVMDMLMSREERILQLEKATFNLDVALVGLEREILELRKVMKHGRI